MKRCVYPDADSVARALADSIITSFKSVSSNSNPTAIMLAGGRTPKSAYNMVAESGISLPSNMTLMVSDERYVPLDHADSNYRMMSPFMDAIRCDHAHRLMVNTALPREECAADFGRRLVSFFQGGGKLTNCFLGLGADGHTASIFSDQHLLMSEGQSAISVDRPDGRIGISATPSIIQKAGRIVFVVTGSDKKDVVSRLLTAPASITAGKVVMKHPHVEVWMDREAAGK